jgi:acyl carrier protein
MRMETEILEEKSIRRRLYRVLRKTGVNKEFIQPSASFREDLNFDNIDWTIFTFFLEGVFNISVKDEELNKFGNVEDTLHYLKTELIYLNN